MADGTTQTRKSNIESVFGSLNITTEDKGKFLTVDNNYNPYWQNINETSIGDSWAYTQCNTPTVVILPKLENSIGGIVAILRNDGAGNNKSYIIIKPHGDEQIMGQEGVWANIADDENYASIVIKAISYTSNNQTYKTWVIVNGVNSWNNYNDIDDISVYSSQSSSFTQLSVRVQKIGSNTISGGVGASGIEFSEFKPALASNSLNYLSYTDSKSSPVIYSSDNRTYIFNNTNLSTAIVTRIGNSISKTLGYDTTLFDNTDNTIISTYITNVCPLKDFILNTVNDTVISKLYLYVSIDNKNNNGFALYKLNKVTLNDGNFTFDGNAIPLYSSDDDNTATSTFGRLISIPLNEDDSDGFSLAFESDAKSEDVLSVNFRFVGVDKEKSISISPEVEFDNSQFKIKESLTITNYIGSESDNIVSNSYMGSESIFSNHGSYTFDTSITKLVFKFIQSGTGAYSKAGEIIIDLNNLKYYLNYVDNSNNQYVYSGDFKLDEDISIGDSGLILCGNSTSIYKLPIQVSINNTVSIIIEKYKTQYSNKKNSYYMPIGAIIAYAGNDMPDDSWLPCIGQSFNKNQYPNLAEVLGVTANGEYKIPDLKNNFIMGYDNSSNGLTKLCQTVEAGLPNITGSLYLTQQHEKGSGITGTSTDYTGAFYQIYSTGNGTGGSGGSIQKVGFTASYSNAIYGKSTTVQPPSIVLWYIIKAK